MAQLPERTKLMPPEFSQVPDQTGLHLRPAAMVMDLQRLGCMYQTRLSFMRILMRRLMNEKWRIERTVFDLDDEGYGVAIYEIHAGARTYSFVAFASFLDASKRSDRVIAEQWDMTVTLCEGHVDDARLERLRANVPLQEQGRLDTSCLILSRANKSVRNFDYVVDTLASGRQPSLSRMAQVGYLYRTTAVYGSGKFGMADWQKVRVEYPDFARPFAAELFTCYLIRQFSLEQADFLAGRRAPATAVHMDDAVKRYVGIGNATGLGMAPFLVRHPLLINRWVEVRETALARVTGHGKPDAARLDRFAALTQRAIRHLEEISTENVTQNRINATARREISILLRWVESQRHALQDWQQLIDYARENMEIETQELLVSLMLELHPELVDDLEDSLSVSDRYELLPEMPVTRLRHLIETRYDWALSLEFDSKASAAVFWYRSAEKMEPRLGWRDVDPGAEREMAIDVARSVRRCYDALCDYNPELAGQSVAGFLFLHPQFRYITRRIQTMAGTRYGDIRANLLAAEVLPVHLLRCKLSFFGVGKFDPKSRLWVRNTMFQGAPLCSDAGTPFADDWCFPVAPAGAASTEEFVD